MATTVSAGRAGTGYRDGRYQAANLGALLIGMVSVQVGASLAKILFPALGAAGTAGLRVLLASAILLLVALLVRHDRFRMPSRRAAGVILAYGVTLGVMNVVFYLALSRLPLGIVVAIEFTGPLGLALIGSRRALDLLWVALAVAGLVLLLQPWQTAHRLDPVGVLLAIAAGGAWALYILVGRRLGRHVSGITATALGMSVAAIVTLPVALPALPLLTTGEAMRHWLLPAALGMALLSSAVPYSIEMFVMQRMSMRGFSILMSLEPAIAALIGLALLGERLSTLRWLAIGGIIAASLGSAATDRPAPATSMSAGGPGPPP